MKKPIIYCIAAATAALASCSDFLEQYPRTELSRSQVYATYEGAQAALNACYSYISNSDQYGSRMHLLLNHHAATMTAGTSSASYVELAQLNVLPTNSNVEGMYKGAYSGINAMNDVLMNLPSSGIDPAQKNRMMGEAHFLRALTYFNLVRMFGPVPLVTVAPGTFEELHRPRTPINEIYETIISDLESAWNLLPAPGDSPRGRPHRYAAKALLAKVYVAMACIKENPDDPFDASWLDKSARDYWQDAYDIASEVVEDGGYDLEVDFDRLWTWDNKYTVESIFELEMNVAASSATFMYNYLPGYWERLPLTNSSNNYGRIRAMRESWDEHYERYLDGDVHDFRLDVTYVDSLYRINAVSTSASSSTAANSWQSCYPYVQYDNEIVFDVPAGVTVNHSSTNQLTYISKYVDPNFTAYDANVNLIVLRFADVLLTLAEAANEIDLTPEAVGYVNRVLARARNTPAGPRTQPADWPTAMSQADFRKNIMIERRLELKAELHEWFDNRRRGSAGLKEIILVHNDRLNRLPLDDEGELRLTSYDFFFDTETVSVKKNLLLPFPAAEISANSSISEADQNFGY